jgi:hypothetical protein
MQTVQLKEKEKESRSRTKQNHFLTLFLPADGGLDVQH